MPHAQILVNVVLCFLSGGVATLVAARLYLRRAPAHRFGSIGITIMLALIFVVVFAAVASQLVWY